MPQEIIIDKLIQRIQNIDFYTLQMRAKANAGELSQAQISMAFTEISAKLGRVAKELTTALEG